VNGQLEETVQDDAASTPVTLDSARIGSWLNLDEGGGHIDRGLHGEISVFRIWNIVTDGQDVCPPAQTPGLIASYVFGHSSDTLLDLSGNSYDGLIHDADWSNDLPPSQQCQRQGFGGFFDGDSDYVQMPQLRDASGALKTTFDALAVDLCKIVILSRFVALSVALTPKVSLLQGSSSSTPLANTRSSWSGIRCFSLCVACVSLT